jgi:hypothetical protein
MADSSEDGSENSSSIKGGKIVEQMLASLEGMRCMD